MRYSFVVIGVFLWSSLLAQKDIDSLRNLASQLEGTERIDVQHVLANRLVNIDPEEAESLSVQMLDYSADIGYELGKAKAFHTLGASYNIRSQLDTAIILLSQSLSLAETAEDQRQIGWSASALGASHLRKYHLNLAMETFQKALVASQKIEDKGLELTSLMNMAIVHTYMKEEDQAETKLQQALEIALANKVTIRTGQIYGNLGNLEFERANYSLSQDYFQKALDEFRSFGASQMLSVVYTQLGRTSTKLGSLEDALNYYDQALEIRQKTGDKRGIGSVLRYKAQTLYEMSRYSQSQNLIDEISRMPESNNDPFIAMDVEEISFKLAEYRRDFEGALIHHKKYRVHKDTVDARAQRQEVKRQTAQFDYTQLTQQLEQERQQKEIAELKRSQQALIILLLTLVIVAGAVVYRINRSRLRKQLIINEQEKELLNQQVINQASKIDEIETEMSRLEDQYSDNAENKKRLIQFLEGTKVEAKDWASFKLLFDKIYPGVLRSLQEFNLTLNDERLVALIILGLSTKEISSILSITPKSVSKARSRLSSKLGLSDTKDLAQFILEKA